MYTWLWKWAVALDTLFYSIAEKGKTDQALEASQLYLKLLAPNIREELHRLLTFVAIASESEGYKLQKQVSICHV